MTAGGELSLQGACHGYLGRRAEVTVDGACPRCHRIVPLCAFDTQEFFCLGPLPLLPLRHYRLFTCCEVCGFQQRLPLAEYRAWARSETELDRLALAADSGRAARLALAARYHDLGLMLDAVAVLAPLLAEPQPPAAAWRWTGLALRGLGLPRRATDAFRRAVEADPHDAEAWLELGCELLRQPRQVREALEQLQQAAALAPDHARVWRALAAARTQAGDWPAAAAAYARLLELEPDSHAVAHYRRELAAAQRRAG